MNTQIDAIINLLPTAITGMGIWCLKKTLDKRETKIEEREAIREKNEVLLIKCVGASLKLGEATACAIKNGKCNGEIDKAVEYAREVKREQRDFLTEQGVKKII